MDVGTFTTPGTSLVDASSRASRLPGDEKVPVAAALELVATATSATSAISLVVGAVGAVGAAVVVSTVSTVSTEELVAEVVLVMSGRALICTAAGMPVEASSCATSWATAVRLDSEAKNSEIPFVTSRTSTMNSKVCIAANLLPLFTSSTETASASTFRESATASCTDPLTLSTLVSLLTSRTKSKLAESEVTSRQTSRSQVVMLAG